MAIRNALPFEFPFRWNALRRFVEMPDEAVDYFDQRDRDLEDFLASLGTFLFPDWTEYTPSWVTTGYDGGSSVQPSVGNGEVGGYYLVVGSLMFVSMYVVLGSTSTVGSGPWGITLPPGYRVAGIKTATATRQVLTGILERPSTLVRCPIVAKLQAEATMADRIGYPRMDTTTGQPTDAGTIDDANPFSSWSADDGFALTGILNVEPT